MNKYEVMMESGTIITIRASTKEQAVHMANTSPKSLARNDKAQAFRIIHN
jgi:hypothetical protein